VAEDGVVGWYLRGGGPSGTTVSAAKEAIIKHKARLVGRGFLQREGIDFDDAFAPVAWMESV
jgi:hypothetical protein